jgi:hypothetical protein
LIFSFDFVIVVAWSELGFAQTFAGVDCRNRRRGAIQT